MGNAKGRLEGKVALITGAGNGIGYAAAQLFAGEGAKVIAADILEKDLAGWNGVENVIPVLADITKLEDIERMVGEAETRFGRLDAVCNIAGINDLSYPLDATDDERWDRVHNIDLKAPFRICRRAVPTMIQGGGGSIVNIGSYAALRGNHGPSYTSAKAGVVGLTKSIAFAYGKQGIRCNIIHPGGTRTDIGAHSGGDYHPAGQALSKIVAAMPVNWFGMPEDIARACLFLCSDDARHINGAEIAVDGGMSAC
ncbi:NAD(P)-dependent dehydrogenase (short-subunit alcohol dehydrogenase family) [Desulfitobacterium sp. LBE]|uniref:SDR family NAD(P)-dependent oxidoreductase n=1 Tax=Desulfitobacterium sp. LBE TaxID=884086 RepID=UPI00119C3552|nr:SDR family oxidoreductase [Desulfitobacterium sp. LBE]TWH57272.1 NAD(P)-dependent dehydrogenase (short-subunit alcohol dehydrogenase family) [Desulfitobacterium sp. LBE]